MLKLTEQAEALVARLKTIDLFNQVGFLESIEGAGLRPAVLPMAQVVLAETSVKLDHGQISANVSWGVLVTAKRMAGPGGLLALVDQVLNELSGFQAVVGARQLAPVKIEFIDRGGGDEASSYALTFTAIQTADL
jgi:hypothetical protein